MGGSLFATLPAVSRLAQQGLSSASDRERRIAALWQRYFARGRCRRSGFALGRIDRAGSGGRENAPGGHDHRRGHECARLQPRTDRRYHSAHRLPGGQAHCGADLHRHCARAAAAGGRSAGRQKAPSWATSAVLRCRLFRRTSTNACGKARVGRNGSSADLFICWAGALRLPPSTKVRCCCMKRLRRRR